MEHSWKTGLCFGLTSGIITTLGLMVGLESGTGSKLVVLGGIVTIAIADAFSDALGIHVSEESENVHTGKEIWISTVSTFLAKFLFAMTFAVPVLLFELSTAILICILWGLSALSVLSVTLSKEKNEPAWKSVSEHLVIAIVVIITTHYIGDWVAATFG